jgi:PucR C-terminal helix-turn-helix domain/GGDEF-like domain
VSTATDESLGAATREVAIALLPELPSIGDEMAAYIESAMPEVAQREARDLVRGSCHANSSMLLDALIRAVPLDAMAPSQEVIQTTRALVRRGLRVSDVVRGYQLGASYWGRRWADAVDEHCPDPTLAGSTVSYGTTFLLGWLERIVERLTDEYRDEAERMAREGSFARTAEVRRALTDAGVDVDEMSQRLGYELRGHHVAFVLRQSESSNDTPLETTARELAAALSPARPLIARVDVNTAWCWVPAADHAKLPPPRASVFVGQGRPDVDLDGFRRSHTEALEALRVAHLAHAAAGTVIRYEDVDLAALCSGEPRAFRMFVVSELGGLAADTADAAKLRSTLRAFFAANSNFRAAAAQLGIHHNTVRYRLEKAEETLGRPIGQRRLHLELALHLAERLGAAST